jgi:hypothetical protein
MVDSNPSPEDIELCLDLSDDEKPAMRRLEEEHFSQQADMASTVKSTSWMDHMTSGRYTHRDRQDSW